MESDKLARALDRALPKFSVEKRKFGRSSDLSIWIEFKSLQKVARVLKTEKGLEFDWLENFSVIEVNEALVVSYFLRSRIRGSCLVVRATVVPVDARTTVNVPSVAEIWPEAEAMEDASSELFGVLFSNRIAPTRLAVSAFNLRRSALGA
ncbi:MAG: NADH-quinone oxidoreductase subunit C [Bdellovibrionota bacterium]